MKHRSTPTPLLQVVSAPVLSLALVLGLALPAAAGSSKEIARELRSNQQVLQDFTWKSRAEVLVGGKTRGVQMTNVRYDMDGTLLESRVGDDDGGKRRGRSAPDPDLLALVEAYTHLTPETLRDLFARATLQPGDGEDAHLVRVQAEGVRSLGDRVDLWVDAESLRPERSAVLTSLDGTPVRIETRFGALAGGPSFPEQTTVETKVKSRPLVLKIENFGLEQQGG